MIGQVAKIFAYYSDEKTLRHRRINCIIVNAMVLLRYCLIKCAFYGHLVIRNRLVACSVIMRVHIELQFLFLTIIVIYAYKLPYLNFSMRFVSLEANNYRSGVRLFVFLLIYLEQIYTNSFHFISYVYLITHIFKLKIAVFNNEQIAVFNIEQLATPDM